MCVGSFNILFGVLTNSHFSTFAILLYSAGAGRLSTSLPAASHNITLISDRKAGNVARNRSDRSSPTTVVFRSVIVERTPGILAGSWIVSEPGVVKNFRSAQSQVWILDEQL